MVVSRRRDTADRSQPAPPLAARPIKDKRRLELNWALMQPAARGRRGGGFPHMPGSGPASRTGAPEAKRKEVVRHSVQLACLGPILEDGELTGPREAERSPRECDGIRLPERALGDNGRHVTEQNVPVDPSPVGELSNLAFKELAVEGLQVAQSLEGGQLGGGLRLRSTESRHESPAELVRGYMQVLYVPVIDGGAGWCCVRVGGVHRKQSILWRIALVRGDQVRPPRWEAVHDEHQQANAR
mmetsp:Transcript_145/g.581  ORF Transcript_145/g.581 Transcript_145/m.581 type:complete len:242 (+) Transcript_145:144-869(+)